MDELQRARFFRDRFVIEARAYQSVDQKKCANLLLEFRTNQTWQVPTMTVLRLWGHLDDTHFMSDSRLEYIDKRFRKRWEGRLEFPRNRWNNAQFQLARDLFAMDQRLVGAMFHDGIPLMAGTDAMNPYCFPGFSLHDELYLLVDSGLTPLTALQAATINPARFMEKTADFGSVEPGKIADLVMLGADPLKDIRNTTQVLAVWRKGKYFDKPALAQMLEAARAAAKH